MQINRYTTNPLSHRNYFGIKGNKNAASWLAASGDGQFSIFDSEKIITTATLPRSIAGIDFLPQQQLIAWHTNKKMQLQKLGGEKIFELQGSFKCVYFSEHHDMLWTIECDDGDAALIKVITISTGSTIATLEIADEYGSSAFSLHPGANKNHLVLFMAAGQDGQSTFFLALDNHMISVVKLPEEDTSPAVFNKSATIYIQGGQSAMYVYSFPQNDLLQTIVYPEAEDTAFYFGFIDEQRVIMAGGNIPSMVNIYSGQLEPIIIAGHEPKPISYYYSTIADDGESATDIEGADVFGSYVLFHCRNQQDPTQEKNSVLIVISPIP